MKSPPQDLLGFPFPNLALPEGTLFENERITMYFAIPLSESSSTIEKGHSINTGRNSSNDYL